MEAEAAPGVLALDEGSLRILRLNRPARLNAFTAASYRLLAELLARADADKTVRVAVLEGAGRAFSSGVDLAELEGEDRSELASSFDRLVAVLAALDTPLVAAVHGAAVGFGATLLLHCDLVVADADARGRPLRQRAPHCCPSWSVRSERQSSCSPVDGSTRRRQSGSAWWPGRRRRGPPLRLLERWH